MHILITGAWVKGKEYIPVLEQRGHRVTFLQQEKDTLLCPYDSIEAVIGNGIFLYHSIEKFTNLKYIQLTSAGYDRVPVEYIRQHHIALYNAKGVYSIPMAEFAISGVLQLYKQSKFFYRNQEKHIWEKNRNLQELHRKAVCIVGCGSVGTACAQLFKAFGCMVIGVNRTVYENPYFSQIEGMDCLSHNLARADIVVLTLPKTKETIHLFDASAFASMKSESILVNIARGAIVDTPALIYSLKNKLLGAVIDVFEEEPLDLMSELWELKNAILTPHNSFIGDGNNQRLAELILKNMEQWEHENNGSFS